MAQYIVHRHMGGNDQILGSFEVRNGSIYFPSSVDEYNCNLFPAGPMAPITQMRIQSLLNNHDKTIYITRAN